jgi:hypothetical protein
MKCGLEKRQVTDKSLLIVDWPDCGKFFARSLVLGTVEFLPSLPFVFCLQSHSTTAVGTPDDKTILVSPQHHHGVAVEAFAATASAAT